MAQRFKSTLWFITILVVFILVVWYRGGNNIYLDFGDSALTVTAPSNYTHTVSYDDVSTLELVELSDAGTAISGDENRKYRWGVWENDTWGQYTLCTAKEIDNAILVTTTRDELFVLNYENNETTVELLEMFTDLLENRN